MEKASWVPLTDSTKTSRKCEPNWLSTKIRMLFSSYRLDQYPDPDGFLAITGTVLEQYDPQVVAIVTSPLTGIQRKCKFPPTIAELVEACDGIRADLAETHNRRLEPVGRSIKVEHQPIKPGEDYDSMFAKYGRPIGRFE